MAYTKTFIAGLQFMWGKGFLSPGGPEEVREILKGHSLVGAQVLDIGSGLGGIDHVLVREHGAKHVTGIDIDAFLVAEARALAEAEGLSSAIAFQKVEPGPLPFDAARFDVVFSKDSLVHVADKLAAYREINRVLKPGGWFLASDWLWSADAADSAAVKAWIPNNPLGFVFTPIAQAVEDLKTAGFADVAWVDRNDVQQAVNRQLIHQLEGAGFHRLAAIVGAEAAAERRQAAYGRQGALDARALLPTHLRARKP